MKPNEKKIWFPAKKYGWGWGLPNCWQGWIVMLAWLMLLGIGGVLLMPKHSRIFFSYTVILVGVWILILFFKGEKPRWRCGKD
ncbi:MAG TPA: hypothetical protein VMV89_06730 [Candidatus Paceibacterota bacterium]|nr:hypothetical protein [Candidatus Paceibacterota bacterium]